MSNRNKITHILKLVLVLSVVLFLPLFQGQALTPLEERQALEEELKKLEEQIGQYEKDITKTQQEKQTLQNQIYILQQKIKKLELQIQQSNVAIEEVGLQIRDTEASIEKTSLEIEDSKKKLAALLRIIHEEDQKSLVEILLSETTLSGFFDNLVQLETLNSKNQEILENIKSLKLYLESEKKSLDEEKADLEKMLEIQMLQKKEGETTRDRKSVV